MIRRLRTPDTVTVVAPFYPLQLLAEREGGDAVAVPNLAKPEAEPHDMELTDRIHLESWREPAAGPPGAADVTQLVTGPQTGASTAPRTRWRCP